MPRQRRFDVLHDGLNRELQGDLEHVTHDTAYSWWQERGRCRMLQPNQFAFTGEDS